MGDRISAPWNWNVPIVDMARKATPEYLRWLAQQFKTNQLVNDAVPSSREINTGLGLTGGGDLTADRTISLSAELDDLTDVDLTTPPTDGQALIFDSGTGDWIAGDVSSGLEVKDEGSTEVASATILNFTGAGVTVTDAGGGQADIDIPGGGGGSTGGGYFQPGIDGDSGTAQRFSGNYFTPAFDLTVVKIVTNYNLVAGEQYTVEIWSMSGSTLVTQMAVSSTVTPGSSGYQNPNWSFTPAALTAGTRYCIAVRKITGGGAIQIQSKFSTTRQMAVPSTENVGAVVTTNAAVGAGDSVTVDGSFVSVVGIGWVYT